MSEYSVVYEQAEDGSWSAYTVDLPVFTVGDTHEEAERMIREAIVLHLSVLADEGKAAPEPRSLVGVVRV